MLDHSGRGKNSDILKHQIEKEHPSPQYENFKVISSGFRNNTKKRKLSEALWIDCLRRSLNKQEKFITVIRSDFLVLLFAILLTLNQSTLEEKHNYLYILLL